MNVQFLSSYILLERLKHFINQTAPYQRPSDMLVMELFLIYHFHPISPKDI